MANDTRRTPSDFIVSQHYVDAFETVFNTIPRDKSLTKADFIKRHETFAKEFRDRLIAVALKASKLSMLISFVNNVFNERLSDSSSSNEQESETEKEQCVHQCHESVKANTFTESVLYSRISRDTLQNNDVNTETGKDPCREIQYNVLISENDIRWLKVPFLALEANQIEVLEMCMNCGLDMETFRNWRGQTLLSLAVDQSNPNYDIINLLLKNIGVNLGAIDGETPVMTCIQNKRISVKERFGLLERLIDAGADVKVRSFHLRTTLHEFITTLSSEMDATKLIEWKSVVDMLLSKCVDINSIDFFGQSILMNAISIVPPTGLEDCYSSDPASRNNIIDARRCKVEIVEYLLHKGANLEVIGKNGYTALCVALASQNVDVVHTIVKHGANVNHLTNVKMSPAYVICSEADWSEEGDIESILLPSLRILLNAGLDINIKGIDDSTVLHFAAAKMNHTICEFLIKSGADIEAMDYLQRTPLHMAVRNANIMVIETLIKLGGDIETKDIHSDTPLTHACLHGNTNAVQILIQHGADYMARGDLGIQPIHMAAENGDRLMMEILQNTGCDLTTPDESGSTPLHYAASDGNLDTVQYLLSLNVKKNCKDYQEQAPLDLALLRGEYAVSTILADFCSTVKFGRLPPGLFPNRPLRKVHELDDYLAEIVEPLKTIENPRVGIGKAILDTSGLGRCHLGEGESNKIYKSIQHLCFEIVERIGDLDPLFQCKLMNAGSSFEGVKIGYPDEFDFVCHMEKFSAFMERVENVDIPEYCQVIMKDSLPPEISRFCVRSGTCLNAGAVLRHFCRLTRIATYDVLKRKHKNLYSGLVSLKESSLEFEDMSIPLGKLQGFTVSWRGSTYKHIDVSVDINPVLYTTEWPSKAVINCLLLPNIQKEGMYLIPKCCKEYPVIDVLETITFESDLWRYSTHHVEAIIMQNLPQKAKDSYMLCKAFRLEPLSCTVQVNARGDWLSEAALKKICPIDEQENLFPYKTQCSYVDYKEHDYESDAVDNDMHKKDINEADNKCKTERDYSDNVKGEEEHNFDLDHGQSTINDSSISILKRGGSGTVSTEYENEEDMYELTAEKCIPSYYLKSIFLQEAEAIFSKSGIFSDIQLQTIPYKVYDRLKIAVETQYLTTIFFPGQNIYRQPHDCENLPAIISMRISYINSILRLMRELGFDIEC